MFRSCQAIWQRVDRVVRRGGGVQHNKGTSSRTGVNDNTVSFSKSQCQSECVDRVPRDMHREALKEGGHKKERKPGGNSYTTP